MNRAPVRALVMASLLALLAACGGDTASYIASARKHLDKKEYSAAIINVVKLNWNRPDNAQPGLRCTLKVIQLPGGDVMSAHAVAPCNADQVTRASIEEAVTKAQPLPYKGYEKVFARELTLIFFYDGN